MTRRSRREVARSLDAIAAANDAGEDQLTTVVINHHSHGSGTFEAAVDPDQPDPEPVSSTTSEQPELTVTINTFASATDTEKTDA